MGKPRADLSIPTMGEEAISIRTNMAKIALRLPGTCEIDSPFLLESATQHGAPSIYMKHGGIDADTKE